MTSPNIFDKLEQDLTTQIQQLQAKQQELLEKKKHISSLREKVDEFLANAREIRKSVEFEPELLKFLQKELTKIFQPTLTSHASPKLPLNPIPPGHPADLETDKPTSVNLEKEAEVEEESFKVFRFVDAQGKNTSF
ncbi:MAG: hypothetical protein NZ901_12545 [Geminocystis sp.]|nr:hypothetical protein [Geminocystis sp.]HIK36450.1 hypothetical protein [Geminocystis sp. M7585_C2015_104]MCS7148998.1 hypothetical protein [Geminocystis sp.]MCX8077362.1 hypothetical protein [Geminocystis sp.]MDW8114815.1 hypothetical protein [Geminocystis sp.]